MTLEKEVRETILQEITEHHANCDCLLCRKGGKIDQAIAKICSLVEGETAILKNGAQFRRAEELQKQLKQAIAKICSLEAYHNAPAEQNEPINYSCTTAKFAEQINMPLWKVMACGKYFEGRLEIDVAKMLEIVKDHYWDSLEIHKPLIIKHFEDGILTSLSQAKDLWRIK